MTQDKFVQDLIKLWNFFKWVDTARWNWERKQGIERLLNYTNKAWKKCGLKLIDDFEPEHLVLSHWLTYIFDYQMPADIIWKKCFPIMARIAKEFQEGVPVGEILARYKKDDSLSMKVETCKHRFMKAHKLDKKLERTLKILEHCCNRDLIELMTRISSYGDEGDWVQRVACALYLLTYDERIDEKAIIRILNDKKEFERYYLARKGNLWHKRLWSALRDYLKSGILQYILKSLENRGYDFNVQNRWRNYQKYLNQLEVPGDVWNEKFYNNVIDPLIKKLGLRLSKHPPKAIRALYKHYRTIFEKYGFYPEQFDVTFDFARILCDRNLCYICPLHNESNKNIEQLCIGDVISKEDERYCPILAVIGYLQPCDPSDCPVYERETLGLCEGMI